MRSTREDRERAYALSDEAMDEVVARCRTTFLDSGMMSGVFVATLPGFEKAVLVRAFAQNVKADDLSMEIVL